LPAKHPDRYLREFAEALGVCHQAVQKKFVKLGITHKKNFYIFGEIRRKTTGVLGTVVPKMKLKKHRRKTVYMWMKAG
jgi:hypothetical protein